MIIVTGMIRSGTSMIAKLLTECGINTGDASRFQPPDRWNPEGYFEPGDIVTLNRQIITGMKGENWITLQMSKVIYAATPPPQMMYSRAQSLKPTILELYKKYKDSAVKDPRFCITGSYWKSAVDIKAYVICVRSQNDTVSSLKTYHRIPMWHGYHIWNYHIMNLINQIGITPFVIVDYSELLGMNYINELKIIKTFFSLRLSDHDLENIYEIAVDKNLRHHKTSDELGVPRRTRELWDKVLSMKVLSPDRQVVLDK